MSFYFFRRIVRKSPLEGFIMFSFILTAIEKLLDRDFVCPCEPSRNIWSCVCYALVPAAASSAFTFYALWPGPRRQNRTESVEKLTRIIYCVGSAFVWLVLFFLDGRYIACASSQWEGIYSEDLVPWCKPLGNATSPEWCQKRTRKMFFISEMVGFALLLLVVCLLGFYSLKNWDRDMTDGTPHPDQIEMQDLMQYHLRSLPVSQLLTLDHASSTDHNDPKDQ
ncbi:hypothetical protein SRHO_G00233540 [Serrasalmus rhombeus]